MPVLSLCLHLSSLTLYHLIVAVFVINYCLECFTNLVIAYIYHFAHILFVYRLLLVLFAAYFLHLMHTHTYFDMFECLMS